MLTRALFLSAGWLALSFIVTLLRGTKVRYSNPFLSLLWLVTVLFCGDVWAFLTFGMQLEIIGLTIIAFAIGFVCILVLPNWNGLGQTLWMTTVLTSVLYIFYSFGVSAFTPLNPLAFLIAFSLTVI